MPKVSIIIPTYNRLEFLKEAIQSVQRQTYRDYELIIVDDGSTDGTKAYLESLTNESEVPRPRPSIYYPPPLRYVFQKNRGVSSARNNGILSSKGEYICFLDSDDRWHKTKLEKQMQVLESAPTQVACYTDEKWILNGKHFNQHKKHRKSGGYIFAKALPLCIISPSSIMLKRELINELGLFDEKFVVCEDYEYWLRLTAKYPVYFIDEPLIIKYGGHEDQLSRAHWGMDRFRIKALEKLFRYGDLSEEQKKQVVAELERKYYVLKLGAWKRRRYIYWLYLSFQRSRKFKYFKFLKINEIYLFFLRRDSYDDKF